MSSASTSHAAKCPNVQFIMDRSGSMSTPLDGTLTRWDVAKNNIKSLLSLTDGTYPIGMTIFPDLSCDSVTSVRPAYFTRSAIGVALDAMGPGGATPSATAVRDVAALSELNDATRPQYVILISDGAPACSGEPDSASGAVNEITLAYRQTPSIVTFVIGMGSGLVSTEVAALNQMADAGMRPYSGATKYYPATTGSEFAASLSAIASRIASEVGSCSDTTPTDMRSDMSMSSDMRGVDMSMSGDMRGVDMSMSGDMRGVDMSMSGDMRGVTDLRQPNTDGNPPVDVDLRIPGTTDDGGYSLPAPVVDWIEPREMAVGVGGPADVIGRNFVSALPSSQVFFDSGTSLSTVPNVLVVDNNKIKVLVPSDLPPGKYDVVVKNPDGQLGRAEGGFTITGKASGCACSIGSGQVGPTSQVPIAAGALVVSLCLLALSRSRRRRLVRV